MDWALDPHNGRTSGAFEVEPVEIVLESGTEDDGEPWPATRSPARLAAPIGRRFAAGILDGLLLTLASALFAAVFLVSGGRFPSHPSVTPEVIGAAVVAFFVVLYFGLFTAVTSATPGQSALGLRVRTLDDRPPDWPAARRRAVGYLVSAAALMIGFVWAVFDGEGLTWHDRMSGTCLAVSQGRDRSA
ncbi:MAG TPA: RDD family protein [Terriglobia bacterium]|nr:RDD family protein [Terriglobia bacterium]